MILPTTDFRQEVLILTYWNVNKLVKYNRGYKWVLILTYWNVNIVRTPVNGRCHFRFNLNLLECKFATPSATSSASPMVLILTYWNVNTKAGGFRLIVTNSFNLNLLECKLRTKIW